MLDVIEAVRRPTDKGHCVLQIRACLGSGTHKHVLSNDYIVFPVVLMVGYVS